MPDLFEMPEQLSPRLKWLREHDITTEATGHSPGDESPETGADLHPWVARAPGIVCGGATEHDAIVELALRKGWRLWNETLPADDKSINADSENQSVKSA